MAASVTRCRSGLFERLLIYTFQEPLLQPWCVRLADQNEAVQKSRARGADDARAK